MSNESRNSNKDYKHQEEQHDIYDLHRQALREPPDPKEGLESPPWWLWTICVLLLFWAGFYLGRYGGVFGPEVHLLQEKKVYTEVKKVTEPGSPEFDTDGSEVYKRVCIACHQSSGEGTTGAFPPLSGSSWVTGNPETPIRIVLHGLKGEIKVKGNSYNSVMPEWGPTLSNEEIAAVITYVRSSWGNSASDVKPEMVKKIRNETSDRVTQWTADELKSMER